MQCTEDELLQVFISLLLALESIHNQGLLHRNISSAHVYLTMDGEKKLILQEKEEEEEQSNKEEEKDKAELQFSNVRLAGQSSTQYKKAVEKFDQMHNICLEHYYLSPTTTEYNKESDLYALGVLFLELATFAEKPTYSPYTYTKEFGTPLSPE